MALRHCPGSKSLIEPQIIVTYCPVCGAEVEFFEYEIERKCPECGRTIKREATQSCILWCKSAAECIATLKGMGVLPSERVEELEKILKKKLKEK